MTNAPPELFIGMIVLGIVLFILSFIRIRWIPPRR